MRLELFRHTYNTEGDRNIIGDLYIDGKFFCYTLEDEKRADGEKVYGKTAIPAIEYKVKITYSPAFKRKLPLIYNVDEDFSVQYEGVKFTGVRFHGGNTSKDSHGCPLVAFNTDGKRIWGTAERKLVQKLQQSKGDITLDIKDAPFSHQPEYLKI